MMFAQRLHRLAGRGSNPSARPWIALVLGWLVVAILGMAAAGEIARRDAQADLARQADAAAALHAAVLRSELEKHRSLPVVLAQDPEVVALLAGAGRGDADVVSAKLETLAGQTRAAAIYVLDRTGVARAASNWRQPTSFVGSDYAFRPYFRGAMQNEAAEFFALGTVSGRPGLYLARRIGPRDQPLGVVVVKVEFDALEADWRSSGEPAYVTDSRGVVLVTSVPEWRFRRSRTLTAAERAAILEDQTLTGQALAPLPFDSETTGAGRIVRTAAGGSPSDWILSHTSTDTPGWTLHLLDPIGGAIVANVMSARAVAGLLVTLLAVGAGVLLRRRQQAMARAIAEEQARAELEQRIDERTQELRAANGQLSREIDERRRAEASREILREELVQANKLATLGQIAAGVAHEINQPVAAIRTHADTANAYLDRNDPEAARRSLVRVAELTGRIGVITDELRAFSRKSTQGNTPVSPAAAIDGALLLIGGRLREGGVELVRTGDPDLKVQAEPIRLEQVVVNLVQNAFEAMTEAGTPSPTLTIDIARKGRRIEIVIADNGPGVDAAVAAALFTPFVTTKSAGLGLGLVICRDIVAGFGGELALRPSATGARFVISLRPAS
ncbi:ATP-binding protein [Brevundimonas sp. NIBR11]|uniref:sensor histidine kinase n=1 Tax=Brevundimonas sp. NIBR11 TaxID=3015999 RepID=UPI0022F1250A|nr:ATP-binding protein [Brevundimonas sp. NIBR11]WGM30348.1 C4-dicarboxylate transport sensor protein DctB [Brevundimonas sp. NIBR11]